MLPHYLALFTAIALSAVGNVLLKAGAGAEAFVDQILRPATIVGFVFYGVSAVLYIIALRKLPLSIAAPSVALSYALVAAVGYFWFRESLSPRQIGGIAAIVVGVMLLN
jgi:small multidrug resistance pump